MYLLIHSITSNIIPFIPLIGLYLQFHLFYLNTKNYWWYIEIVNVHLVVLLQKMLENWWPRGYKSSTGNVDGHFE